MSALSQLDLIQSHRWSRLLFTTYALSLSFFEAVILDRVLRQQIRSCTVLADVSGIRASMDEIGSTSAGKTYDLEPVAVKNGCFHPKLLALLSGDEVALAITSGNLTFGGWGSNLECIEYLHPSFASNAFNDTAEFLELLATSERVTHEARNECLEVAGLLRAGAAKFAPSPRLRVLHSLRRSILDQIEEFASDLGGASQLVIASPFFDNIAVPTICKRLKVEYAHLHAHDGGTVLGSAGSNWPGVSSERCRAIRLTQLTEKTARLLHAKMYEIVCRRGRIVVSGSPNATNAALSFERNVELCVARISQSRTPWHFVSAKPPERTAPLEVDPLEDDDQEIAAVLRAALEGANLTGRVIGTFPAGDVTAYKRAGLIWNELCTTSVRRDGNFGFTVPAGWQTFQTGQSILRLRHSSGLIAQGFVSLPDLREISQRLGASAPHFFSILEGRETPADVAAILDYIYQNPDWLPKNEAIDESTLSGNGWARGDGPVDLNELLNGPQVAHRDHGQRRGDWHAWQNFMQDILAAFSRPGGALVPGRSGASSGDAEDDDEELGEEDKQTTIESEKALRSFNRLFDKLLNMPRESRPLPKALAITQYICSRLALATFQTLQYLKRIVDAFEGEAHGKEERNLLAAATLLWSMQLTGESARNAIQLRRQLLRAGFEILSSTPPDLSSLGGFIRDQAQGDLNNLWQVAASLRVPQEEARHFWDFTGTLAPEDFPFLRLLPEWRVLRHGPSPKIHRLRKFASYCPKTGISLPLSVVNRLKQDAAATCRCGKILLCEEV